jgi:mannose-1-phosphate guanylyltransferase
LGASATAPEVEYGWIEPEPLTSVGKLMRVKRFWEKPSCQVAQALLDTGCLWNTFVMVGRASAFLELIQSAEPNLLETFRTAVQGEDADPEFSRAVHERIEPADFSKRVLSGFTERLAVMNLGNVGWHDLGDPGRVKAMMSQLRQRKPIGQALVSSAASFAAAG